MGEGLAASYPFLRSLLGPATWSLGATCSIVARGRGRGRLVVEGILEQMGLGGGSWLGVWVSAASTKVVGPRGHGEGELMRNILTPIIVTLSLWAA